MRYICFILLVLSFWLLCFYTKCIVAKTIRFKRNHNLKIMFSDVEIITHIVVYTFGIMDIGICIWALVNI